MRLLFGSQPIDSSNCNSTLDPSCLFNKEKGERERIKFRFPARNMNTYPIDTIVECGGPKSECKVRLFCRAIGSSFQTKFEFSSSTDFGAKTEDDLSFDERYEAKSLVKVEFWFSVIRKYSWLSSVWFSLVNSNCDFRC